MIPSAVKLNNPITLNEFRNQLLTVTKELAHVAECFRAIEMLFMAGDRDKQQPEYLARLCGQILCRERLSTSAKLPNKITKRQYLFDENEKRWKLITSDEGTSKDRFKQDLTLLAKLVVNYTSKNPGLIKTYFERQKQFYISECKTLESKRSSNSKQEERIVSLNENAVLFKENLTASLKEYSDLLCKSPEKTAEDIYAKSSGTNELTVEFCTQLIINIFVGRFLIAQPSGLLSNVKNPEQPSDLHPQVITYISSLAETCYAIYSEFKLAKKSIPVENSSLISLTQCADEKISTKNKQPITATSTRRNSDSFIAVSRQALFKPVQKFTIEVTLQELQLLQDYRQNRVMIVPVMNQNNKTAPKAFQ